jgi:hypothetical protein
VVRVQLTRAADDRLRELTTLHLVELEHLADFAARAAQAGRFAEPGHDAAGRDAEAG